MTGDSGEDIDAWKERVTAQGEQALWPYHLLAGLLFWLLNLRCADYSTECPYLSPPPWTGHLAGLQGISDLSRLQLGVDIQADICVLNN